MSEKTYTINEAAALTGLHRNTIRQRVKLGQLKASVHAGKFGDEYRITRQALVEAGLLSPLDGNLRAEDVLEATFTGEESESEQEVDGQAAGAPAEGGTVAALGELYQRHEQAMFRLGYLQAELERVKALADTAESLRVANDAREQELRDLRASLDEKERQASEAETLRRELEATQARLREMEDLRRDIESLKQAAAERKRGWWPFGR